MFAHCVRIEQEGALLVLQNVDVHRGFINFWHKWIVFNIRWVSFWKAQRAFLTRESGGMLPTRVVSLLQGGRITRYTAIIETPDVQLWPYLKVH